MTIQDIMAIVKTVKSEDRLNITPDSCLVDDLRITSLEMMFIIYEIEQNYDVKVNVETLNDVKTVRNLFENISF